MFASKDIFLKSSGGYQISRSVRFRSSASAYFNRTPTTAGNRKTWTWSGWVKRGKQGAINYIFGAPSSYSTAFRFNSANTFFFTGASSTHFIFETTAVYRDSSAWYHVVIALDTTQATSTNRVKIYINGNQVTAFAAATYPSLNLDGEINNAHYHGIGTPSSSDTHDGYLTEVNFIDGQALTPSSFGETNSVTGVWQPIKYTGTYGTNGFYLNFSDNSGVTATTIGKDYSGNGNNWTPNNISVTAGATYDSMIDVPTLTDANTANYCVLNPLNNTGTTASANLNWNGTDKAILSTIAFPTTGKYYFEATCSTVANFSIIGIANSAIYASAFNGVISSANFRTYNSGGEKADSTRTASWGSTFTNNDIIGVAVDMDNGAIYFAKNNTWQASGVPTSGASKTGAAFTDLTSSGLTWTPFFGATNINGVWIANFGQRPFAYTPPTGFVALNTQNLPDATIKKGNAFFDVVTRAGTGAVATVSSLSFMPDLVWGKARNNPENHNLFDSVRGVTNALRSNTTDAESTQSGVTAFNSNGYSLGAGAINNSGSTYVDWLWNAGGNTVSNTSGSITSQVRANPTAGFSVVTYTGAGGVSTIGHGLGVAPSFFVVKNRTQASDWECYFATLGNTTRIVLNSTAAQVTGVNGWNSTSPTSTVFTVNGGTAGNTAGNNHLAYCFAAVAGYSAFGKYTGNGSADGPFVYLGFRPRFIMWKNASAVEAWLIEDTARSTYNEVALELYPSSSGAEAAGSSRSPTQQFDYLSNGFKVRGAQSQTNGSGNTIIYAAFAENPFKLSLAR